MTDSLITKGPWRVVNPGAGSGHLFDVCSGDDVVCLLASWPDARLIAAAPKLLEALKEISEMCVYSPEGGHEEVADCVRIARAAIKEATE